LNCSVNAEKRYQEEPSVTFQDGSRGRGCREYPTVSIGGGKRAESRWGNSYGRGGYKEPNTNKCSSLKRGGFLP